MEFDDLLRRYFGTGDFASVAPAALAAGVERCQVDLGLETDQGKRFALWAMLYMLGAAPELSEVFDDPAAREAARDFMDMIDAA
ncbi:hypothetical protein [Pelagerythrobacter sp.]|uniref:hypothetical protein n=1 Tax=Pelagerythrobacter sp. TaxID=2800702 RepID=UPI0035AD9248